MSGEWQHWLALSVAFGLFLKLELIQQRVMALEHAQEMYMNGRKTGKRRN